MSIRNGSRLAAALPITSNATPQAIFTFPMAKKQKVHFKFWVAIQVGATGGVRFTITGPGGVNNSNITTLLINTVAPSITSSFINAFGTAFTNALANAGKHWLQIDVDVETNNTAGDVSLNIAQNTSDALTLTVLQGSTMDTEVF